MTVNTQHNRSDPVSGLVDRVTFHSEDTGFAVLRVKARGHRDLITVVGTLPSVTAGEWIEASGEWIVDRKHGQQFKADTIQTTQPDTLEGIEKYLGSGMIKGIGPVYAAKLVKKFGKEVFEVIESTSALLERVDGIGPMRRASIKAAWNEQKSVREIMTFLFSHGVSTARAFRIYKTYGEDAIEKVRLDPYCLAKDIHGIGFQTADKIAASLGIPRDSDLRARAGVEYVLQELTDDGHCAYPRSQLTEAAVRILDIPENIVETAVDHLVSESRLVPSRIHGREDLVFLASLEYAERQLARHLIELAKGKHPSPAIDADKAIGWVQEKISLTLDDAQAAALRNTFSSKVMVITGGPGVGKTTLIRAILKIFRVKKQKVVLCAPTGRAAKRISETTGAEAKTIHRLLIYDPKRNQFKHDAEHPLSGDIFIVDEASMIDLPLAYQLIRAIPLHAALVIVGDVDQLPSVGPGCVLRDIIESNAVPVSRLTHIFRQAARSAIVTNAHRVNEGLMPEFPAEKPSSPDASDFYFVAAEEPEKACRMIVRLVTESIPKRFGFKPREDIQVLTPMQRGELGARNLNVQLQQALNPRGEALERFGWTYRVGDKVMQLQNDYDKDVFNGDIGRIVKIDETERELHIRYDDRTVSYDFRELDELALSYATTIHKSQGSEYPCVVVPIHTQHFVLLQRNLLYTAITRGKKLVVLVGTQKALSIAIGRMEAHTRITTLKERLAATKT